MAERFLRLLLINLLAVDSLPEVCVLNALPGCIEAHPRDLRQRGSSAHWNLILNTHLGVMEAHSGTMEAFAS